MPGRRSGVVRPDTVVMVVLVRDVAELAAWPLAVPACPDLALVDELSRLQLAARRLGCSIQLRQPGAELMELLDLVGLQELVAGVATGWPCHHLAMASWRQFASAEPDFARRVQDLLASQRHMTLATLRRDGSPRISGTEAHVVDGELVLDMVSGSLKARDLQRDPRLALHGPAVDPPVDEPRAWDGDAKIAGRAVEIPGPEGSHHFRIDITEVVVTRVGPAADHLVIESWHPERGPTSRERR